MPDTGRAAPLLELRDLRVAYGALPVVRGVSIALQAGEILGVVGESGCGKSTLLGTILGLLPREEWTAEGQILFAGQDLASLPAEAMRRIRGEGIGAVFQDPGDSLNPSRPIKTQFFEALRAHRPVGRREARSLALEALERLNLRDGAALLESYPFQLSGGQKQRVAIALAMVLQPALLLADEPTSALDVTVQAQVIRELMDLRARCGTAMVLVTHNLGVAAHAADRLAVLYAGLVVEAGDKRQVLAHPAHPYTRSLLAAIPDFSGRLPQGLPGAPPPLGAAPAGCAFAPRCPLAGADCARRAPVLAQVGPDHFCACERGPGHG